MVFKIDRLREALTLDAPNAALVTNLLGIALICVDENVIFMGGLRLAGPTFDGAANIQNREPLENTFDKINHYVAQDSIISLVTMLDYTGGGVGPPLTRAVYRVHVTGSLIIEPTNLGRGRRFIPPVVTVADFAIYQAKFNL
jgi:hypothetical protein